MHVSDSAVATLDRPRRRLSGYIFDEKVAIARSYLEPQARSEAGVPPGAVAVTDAALACLVEEYAREAGVRNLKKHLEKIFRKAALKLVQSGALPSQQQLAAQAAAAAAAAPAGLASPAEAAAAAEGVGGAAAAAAEDVKAAAAVEPSPGAAPEAASGAGSEAQQQQQQEQEEAEAFAEPLLVIDVGDLKEYIGQPPFPSDRIYKHHTPAGERGLRAIIGVWKSWPEGGVETDGMVECFLTCGAHKVLPLTPCLPHLPLPLPGQAW